MGEGIGGKGINLGRGGIGKGGIYRSDSDADRDIIATSVPRVKVLRDLSDRICFSLLELSYLVQDVFICLLIE